MKVFKKQGRNNIGQYRKSQRNIFVLWGEKPKTWQLVKDFMLFVLLMNALIGQMKKVDVVAMIASETHIIARESVVETAKAEDIQSDEKEPETKEYERIGVFSAYNSEESQTDSDPFTMANGKRVHAGAIANNCLAFGTKVEVEGMGTFTVEDRMNKRYGCDHFDIWMDKYSDAINFGRKSVAYEVGE